MWCGQQLQHLDLLQRISRVNEPQNNKPFNSQEKFNWNHWSKNLPMSSVTDRSWENVYAETFLKFLTTRILQI